LGQHTRDDDENQDEDEVGDVGSATAVEVVEVLLPTGLPPCWSCRRFASGVVRDLGDVNDGDIDGAFTASSDKRACHLTGDLEAGDVNAGR
jgi:hypothetical protein